MAALKISRNLGMTAPVLSCVMMCLGRMVTKSPERTGEFGGRPTAWREASFSMRVRGMERLREGRAIVTMISGKAGCGERGG